MLSLIKIQDVASYDDESGVLLNDLKRINFIYGANGCGKTTISNFLLNPSRTGFSKCVAAWEHNSPLTTYVYNKEFREDNFKTGKIAGVFTLGKASKDEIEEIEKKKQLLTGLQDFVKQKKETLIHQNKDKEKTLKDFEDDRWSVCYQRYKDDFKEAFRGNIKSGKSFSEKLISICGSEFDSSSLPSLKDLQIKAETVFGETPEQLTAITLPQYEDIEQLESDGIWSKVIVGKSDVDIAGLITKLGSNDWVDKGRSFLQDDNTCPFCQQKTISESFRRQLEEYFDETFTHEKNNLTIKKNQYESLFKNILENLQSTEISEKQNTKTLLDIDTFSTHLKALQSQALQNIEHIKTKLENTSQLIVLTPTKVEWSAIKKCIEKANDSITEQNRIINNLKEEQKKLKEKIWEFVAHESKTAFDSYMKKSNGLTKGIEAITQQIKLKELEAVAIDQEIKELNKNVTSVQPTVDEINRLLRAFGFHNFLLVPSPDIENHYTIQREDGSLAHSTLSEGEITFITFLYFLQLVKGGRSEATVTDDRVVVIDDPISSLDSNVLFIVSSLIKELIIAIKNDESRTKQLILLTHNVYFHKEVSFIDGRTKNNNQTNYWIIRKIDKISRVQAYGMENPIESSYELLWREIKNWRSNSGITVQNTMRRIIENYFKILGKYGDDDLIKKFDTQEERETCKSLLSWINDGSHCLPDDLYIQTPDDCIERYHSVFKSIFEHTDNLGHYNMMMGEPQEANGVIPS